MLRHTECAYYYVPTTMILKIAFRNTFRQKRRTILTGLAMIVGFTLLSVTIGFVRWGRMAVYIEMFNTKIAPGIFRCIVKGILISRRSTRRLTAIPLLVQTIQGTTGVDAWTPRMYAAGTRLGR